MSIEARGWIKPHSSKFTFLARCLDSALVVISLWCVLQFNGFGSESDGIALGLLAALLLQFVGEFAEIYRSWRSETVWSEAKQVLYCWFASFSVLLLFGGFLPLENQVLEWPAFMQWFSSSLLFLLGWRLLARSLLYRLRAKGFNTRRVAVVGNSDLAKETARRLVSCTWGGYSFAGFYDDRQTQAQARHKYLEKRRCKRSISIDEYAGELRDLIRETRAGRLDSVFIALPMSAEARIQKLIQKLSNSTASVYVIPDLFTFELLHSRSVNLNGIPAIGVIGEPHRGVQSLLKRAEDVIGALLILSLIAIPMLLIACAVKATSRGPVFFLQLRYGLDGKPFKVWKFRTMTVCENNPTEIRQAQRNDKRLTPIGGFLRRTSLDELPQFFNVLQGSMSIVGPRPHAVAHNELYREQIQGYMLRHKIKPGITGWAQINGWRGETDTLEKMQKRIEYDLHYIRHWSLLWDIKIVLKTIFKGFGGKNAY